MSITPTIFDCAIDLRLITYKLSFTTYDSFWLVFTSTSPLIFFISLFPSRSPPLKPNPKHILHTTACSCNKITTNILNFFYKYFFAVILYLLPLKVEK